MFPETGGEVTYAVAWRMFREKVGFTRLEKVLRIQSLDRLTLNTPPKTRIHGAHLD
jgi:hypothetical protein